MKYLSTLLICSLFLFGCGPKPSKVSNDAPEVPAGKAKVRLTISEHSFISQKITKSEICIKSRI